MNRLYRLLIVPSVLMTGAAAYADEPTDSIADQHLDEVTVEAATQRVGAKLVEYTPTTRQKNSSSTGTMLLEHMAIPELNVSPVDGAVKTMIGDEVNIFIDYVPASTNDLEGMRTKDVLKVEYYDYPTDPRFMGAKHVVNFIMQQYQYGGYTKLSGSERMIAYDMGNYSAFSKMAYKKMTYDAYLGGNFQSSKQGHTGDVTDEVFRLGDNDRLPSVVNRHSELWTRNKYDKQSASFRARYVTDKVQITNSVMFNRSHSPFIATTGVVTYDTPLIAGGESKSLRASQSISPSYQGSFYFTLPNEFSLSVSPSFTYSHNKEWNSTTEGSYYDVVNNVREDAYYTRMPIQLNKRFAQVHNVLVGIDGLYLHNRVNYAGSYPSDQNFHLEFGAVTVGYSSQLGKFYTNIDGGLSNEWSTINGHTTTHFYPFLHVQEQFVPNNKSQLSFWFQYASSSPDVSEKSENYIRLNELMWATGTPGLNNSDHVTVSLNYTWLPNNRFRLGVYGSYFGMYDCKVTTFEPRDGYIVRKPVNNGDFTRYQISVNGVAYLFDRSLVLQLGPSCTFARQSGILKDTFNSFYLWGNLTWYHGNFWVSGYLNTPSRNFDNATGTVFKQGTFYQVSAGWGNSTWTVSAQWQSFARYSWLNYHETLYTANYDKIVAGYNTGTHSNIGITVTYTIGYGKKVTRGDEIGSGSDAGSAILK